MELNEYELERQAKLAENAALLASLGLDVDKRPAKKQRIFKSPLKPRSSEPIRVRPQRERRISQPNPVSSQESSSSNDLDFEADDDLDLLVSSPAKSRKRSNKAYERNGRIYDPVFGTSCHQCRQKTLDPKVACTNILETWNGKEYNCPLMMCCRCLPNRYGQDVFNEIQNDWLCPKCTGICNCSFCMRAKGRAPTGIMIQKARALGFDCVADMLEVNGPMKSPNADTTPRQKRKKTAKDAFTPKYEEQESTEEIEEEDGFNGELVKSEDIADEDEKSQKAKAEVEEDDDDDDDKIDTASVNHVILEANQTQEEYQVESIISAHIEFNNSRILFLTRWAGFSASDDTKEPYSSLHDLAAMDAFEAANPMIRYCGAEFSLKQLVLWETQGRMRSEIQKVVRRGKQSQVSDVKGSGSMEKRGTKRRRSAV